MLQAAMAALDVRHKHGQDSMPNHMGVADSPEVVEVIQQLQRLQHELSHKVSLQHRYLESLSAYLNLSLGTHAVAQGQRSVAETVMKPTPEADSGDLSTEMQIDDDDNKDPTLSQDPTLSSPTVRRRRSELFKQSTEKADCLTRFAGGSGWALISLILILVNTAIIGYETQLMTQYQIKRAIGDKDATFDGNIFKTSEMIFLVWMIIELLVNAYAQKWEFIKGKDWHWNWFDVIIVTLTIAMQLVQTFSVSFLRVLRLLRLGKILRTFRVFKFVRGVRSMIISMSGSFMHLVSAMLVMSLFIYIVTLVFMQGIAADAEDRNKRLGVPMANTSAEPGTVFEFASGLSNTGDWERINTLYGSMDRAMMTLFLSISNGIAWSVAAEPIARLSSSYGLVWTAFMAFMLFGMLNVLTGIFVDAAIKAMMNDRDNLIQAHLEDRESLLSVIRAVFKEVDTDDSGSITASEFEVLMEDEDLLMYLSALGIYHGEAKSLFALLDEDGSGKLSMEEFVNGFLKLKGSAKALDTAFLMHENRKIRRELRDLSEEPRLSSGSEHVLVAANGPAVDVAQQEQQQQQQEHCRSNGLAADGSLQRANSDANESVLHRVLSEISGMLERDPSDFAKKVGNGEEATVENPDLPWLEDQQRHGVLSSAPPQDTPLQVSFLHNTPAALRASPSGASGVTAC